MNIHMLRKANSIWFSAVIGLLMMGSAVAAELNDSGALIVLNATGSYFDKIIPNDMDEGALLFFSVKGGDGGNRQDWGNGVHHLAKGGQGARVSANFSVGYNPGELPSGSTVRFILGKKGVTEQSTEAMGTAGGGGSAILFLPPGGAQTDWVELLIAGGGGGAYADISAIANSGGGGDASDCVDASGVIKGTAGGDNANDVGAGYGGAGAYRDGSGGVKAGWLNKNENGPKGGSGGTNGSYGGYGYGGGGSSVAIWGPGGGGGGACGGNAGETKKIGGILKMNFQGGHGGRSYVNPEYAKQITRVNGGQTNTPADGEATYRLYKADEGRMVFATSTTFVGNLGGSAGAHQKCQTLADSAGLPGTYKAWVGTENESPLDTLFAQENQKAINFVLPDDNIVGNYYDNLVTGHLLHAINRDENGVAVSGNTWTGARRSGLSDPYDTCNNWTNSSSEDYGRYGGTTLKNEYWSEQGNPGYANCSIKKRLFCFEQ